MHKQHVKRKRVLLGAMAAVLALAIAGVSTTLLAGCSSGTSSTSGSDATEAATTTESGVTVHVASLKGPTSVGLVHMMDEADSGAYANDYEFTIAGSPDDILPGIIQGDYDIALVPSNSASVLYNKTDGGVSVIDINTLGVLYVITGDSSVTSLEDLAGKTVYLTGKGSSPEYVMNYLLEQAGIADQVTLEFRDEATELVSILESDPNAVCVMPEPFATSALAKVEGARRAFSLTDEWDSLEGTGDSALIQGVTVVRTEFLEEHPDVVAEFIAAQSDSVDWVNDNPDDAATLVVDAGIIDDEEIAAEAIPNCQLVCITGDDMKEKLSGYLQVLYDQDPSSVGGEMPGDDFYATDAS
jgi:NitT/TauT family transport system substrate-binding protein